MLGFVNKRKICCLPVELTLEKSDYFAGRLIFPTSCHSSNQPVCESSPHSFNDTMHIVHRCTLSELNNEPKAPKKLARAFFESPSTQNSRLCTEKIPTAVLVEMRVTWHSLTVTGWEQETNTLTSHPHTHSTLMLHWALDLAIKSLRQYSRVWQQACRGVCQSQQWPHLNRWDQGCQQCVTLTKCDHIVTASLDQCDHSGATSAWNPPNQWPIQTQHRHNMTEGDQMFKVGKVLETKQEILQKKYWQESDRSPRWHWQHFCQN